MLPKVISLLFCLSISLITCAASGALVSLAQQRNQDLFAKLIENTLAQKKIAGEERVQFFKDFKKFKNKKRKAYKRMVLSSDPAMRKAFLMSYIDAWRQRHPEIPAAVSVSVAFNEEHGDEGVQHSKALTFKNSAIDLARRERLLEVLGAFPAVLIDLVQEYEQSFDSFFLPMSAPLSNSLCDSSDKESVLLIFELDLFKSLRCNVFSSENYPCSWGSNKVQFFRNVLEARHGSRVVFPSVMSARVDVLQAEFQRICGVRYEIVRPLEMLLDMEARIIKIDSEECRNFTAESSIMLDPHSLTMHELAAQMKDVYVKLREAVQKAEFRTLDHVAEQCLVQKYIRTYETRKAMSLIERLKQTEYGVTSLLFSWRVYNDDGFSRYGGSPVDFDW